MLPRVIEYLLTLEVPGSGSIVVEGMNQRVQIIPPGAQVPLVDSVVPGDYANIVYRTLFDPAMIPDVLNFTATYFGVSVYSGLLTEAVLQNGLDHFVVITSGQQARATVQNNSPLNQYYVQNNFFVRIPTTNNWDEVISALHRLETSARTETLLDQATCLLENIRKLEARK